MEQDGGEGLIVREELVHWVWKKKVILLIDIGEVVLEDEGVVVVLKEGMRDLKYVVVDMEGRY